MSTTTPSSQIEPIRFQGWEHCWRIASNEIELVVTADVGPRVIHCGLRGGQNPFKTFENQMGRSGEPSWMIRGGSRIWIGPEHREASYAPDNGPVDIQIQDGAPTAAVEEGPRVHETDDRARGRLKGGDCAPHQKCGLTADRIRGLGADGNGSGRRSGQPASRRAELIRSIWLLQTRWSCGGSQTYRMRDGRSFENTWCSARIPPCHPHRKSASSTRTAGEHTFSTAICSSRVTARIRRPGIRISVVRSRPSPITRCWNSRRSVRFAGYCPENGSSTWSGGPCAAPRRLQSGRTRRWMTL